MSKTGCIERPTVELTNFPTPSNTNKQDTITTVHIVRDTHTHTLHIHIQACTHLAEVGVQFSESTTKLLHVLSQKLVRIGDAVVKVAHLVVSEAAAQRDDRVNAFTCCQRMSCRNNIRLVKLTSCTAHTSTQRAYF